MINSNLKHILFLPTWYPHRYDAMDGLFVRKHALAVSKYVSVTVLYLQEDNLVNTTEVVSQNTDGINEVIVYYKSTKVVPHLSYRRAFMKGWNYVVQHFGLPDVSHVHVLGKAGLCAYWLKKKYKIPYVVTEHWSGFLENNFRYKGFGRKRTMEMVVRNAHCIMPVSGHLAERMQYLNLKGNYRVVYNVVDDFFYYNDIVNSKADKIRLLHVSCFDDEPKNIIGLLNVIALLRQRRTDFTLTLVGAGRDLQRCKDLSERLSIGDICTFMGELTPHEVARQMQKHDVFVMFSNYENAPVVLSEALAVGLPVVATNVGGIPEMISAAEGILVEPKQENQLADALNTMCDTYYLYDKKHIREQGLKYSFETVGRQLYTIYAETANLG